MNKVFLIGNVGQAPELKKVNEVPYCIISVATNESYKDKDGNWQNKAEWYNVVLWKGQAEFAVKHIKKGSKIGVEGKLRTRSWQDKETGKTMYSTEIIANEIELLDKKEKNETSQMGADDLPW
jgi:single-strand DNA-binding protein